MSHESEDLDVLKDEIQMAALNGVSQVLSLLSQHYAGRFDDDGLSINNEFLIALANVSGSHLALIPEEFRDQVSELIHENIDIVSMVVAAEADLESGDEGDDGDLASMTPVGSC